MSDVTTIQARHGKAAPMKAGQRLKLVNPSGFQVVDCWAFCDPNTDEFMSMEHTRLKLLNAFTRKGDVMVSNLYTPMITLEDDSSAGWHDTQCAACSPALYAEFGMDSATHRACSTNLIEGMKGLGLQIPEQPCPWNLFQHTFISGEGEMTFPMPGGTQGCHVTLRAECDLIIAFSCCPWDHPEWPVNGPDGQINDCEFTIA